MKCLLPLPPYACWFAPSSPSVVSARRGAACVLDFQVAGGGAVEAALSIYLDSFATTLGTREQLAIAEFSQALLVIPKTLAVNAALDATEVVSQLCVYHNTAQKVVRNRQQRVAASAVVVSVSGVRCYVNEGVCVTRGFAPGRQGGPEVHGPGSGQG